MGAKAMTEVRKLGSHASVLSVTSNGASDRSPILRVAAHCVCNAHAFLLHAMDLLSLSRTILPRHTDRAPIE